MQITQQLFRRFENENLETRNKTRVCFSMIVIYLLFFILLDVLYLSQKMELYRIVPYNAGIFFCLITLILFFLVSYPVTAYFFILFSYLTVGMLIFIDTYNNPMVIYRNAVALVLIFAVILVTSISRRQLVISIFTGNILLLSDFFYKLFTIDQWLTPVTMVAINTGFVFYNIISFLSILSLAQQKKMIAMAQSNEAEAVRRLKITEVYTRKSLVDIISRGENPLNYSPREEEKTILFSDIRNFTGITEHLKHHDVIHFLNLYFDLMNETIIRNGGEIDKLIGDCIMAFFDSPDDAIRTAVDMRRSLTKFNEIYYLPYYEDLKLDYRINNGIGINIGRVVIGNIGSRSKMDYTLIGDIVNVASRLESLTKYYQCPVLVSEEFRNQLSGNYRIRFIDEALVKGKVTPVRIYQIYDDYPEEIFLMIENMKLEMEEAYHHYQAGEFEKALMIYRKLAQSAGPHHYKPELCADPLLDTLIVRAELLNRMKNQGALPEWNGVFNFSRENALF